MSFITTYLDALRHIRTEAIAVALRQFARARLTRHPIKIIAVTGSVGKTTTKECVADTLASTYDVRRTIGNSNCRTGVPSTILGVRNAYSLGRFIRSFPTIVRNTFSTPSEADYLVLEVGARLPGQIPTHLNVFHPFISIVTSIAPAHLETLGTIENIIYEKSSIVRALPSHGYAVLCGDDDNVRKMASQNRGKTLFFGYDRNCDVWVDKPQHAAMGLTTVIHDRDISTPLSLPGLTNADHLYAVMAAWCVGLITGVDRKSMASALAQHGTRRGRGSITTGPEDTLIYDDTFNANPASMKSSLQAFVPISEGRRRIVVLGSMLELGADATLWHEQIGSLSADIADVLIACGIHAQDYLKGYVTAGGAGAAVAVDTPEAAYSAVIAARRRDDAIFLKGSHGSGIYKLADRLTAEAKTVMH